MLTDSLYVQTITAATAAVSAKINERRYEIDSLTLTFEAAEAQTRPPSPVTKPSLALLYWSLFCISCCLAGHLMSSRTLVCIACSVSRRRSFNLPGYCNAFSFVCFQRAVSFRGRRSFATRFERLERWRASSKYCGELCTAQLSTIHLREGLLQYELS